MAEVATIKVLDADGVEREVPTLLSVEQLIVQLFGEVAASPTANTVLDRLKDVTTAVNDANTAIVAAIGDIPGGGGSGGDASAENQLTAIGLIDGLEGLVTSLNALTTTQNGYVDGLETLIGSSNSALANILTGITTTLAGYVDGLEGLVTSSNTKLDTIHSDLGTTLSGLLTDLKGYTDGLETLVTSSNTKLDTIHTDLATTLGGYVDGLEALLTSLNGYVDGLEALVAAATPAGENHIGKVGGNTSYIDVTLSLDTSAYADGDLMADTQVVTNAMRVNDGTGVLQSVQVLDEDDTGAAFDLLFLSANNTMGSENAAPSVSDANARDILGFVKIEAADFIDLGGARIATKTGVGLVVKPASGTRNLYVAAISRATPTHTASGVRLRLGFLLD